jgi:hypothetical protein
MLGLALFHSLEQAGTMEQTSCLTTCTKAQYTSCTAVPQHHQHHPQRTITELS